ncbi:MAG: ABC transporter ATP-binding protein, partial [Proteobacteria bacterium]|nr:ABC transporter ATP-binding protein [Pseudomonadota bacterium]
EILLLDEPLSNLEMEARVAMRRELRRLQEEIGLIIIYVTHDQVEALSLADRIAVMHCGKILQLEETTQICNRPDHLFVADFLGSPPMNLVSGEFQMLDGIVHFVHDSLKIKAGEALSACAGAPSGIHAMGIRPDAIRLVPSTSAPIAGRIMLTELRGPEAVVTVAVGSLNLKVLTQPDTIYREGDSVGLSMDPSAILFYSKETSRRINLAPLR